MSIDKNISKNRKGLYLLPNLLTTASLFAAFYAIIAAINGRFEAASIAIFVAMIMDTLDGRVARMMGSQSDFGAQYDSLADIIAFGLSPALIAFIWSLSSLGKIGWLIAFVYTSAAALRLARFNTQIDSDDKNYFQGLPCPIAAGFVSCVIWLSEVNQIDGSDLSLLLLCLLLCLALLMVSQVRYHSFKQMNWSGRMPTIVGILVVLIFVSIAINPPFMLLIVGTVYVLSGPVLTVWNLHQRRKHRNGR